MTNNGTPVPPTTGGDTPTPPSGGGSSGGNSGNTNTVDINISIASDTIWSKAPTALGTSVTATTSGATVNVTGTAKYLSSWSEFSSTVPTNGYYIALKIMKPDAEAGIAKVKVEGARVDSNSPTEWTSKDFFSDGGDTYANFVKKLVVQGTTAQNFTMSFLKADGTVAAKYTINLANLTLGEIPTPTITVAPSTATSANLLNQDVSNIQTGIGITPDGKTIKVTGASKYITGWTDFSSDPNLQAGNYVALKFTLNTSGGTFTDVNVTFESIDNPNKTLIATGKNAEDLIWRIRDKVTPIKVTINYKEGGTSKEVKYTIDLSGMTLLTEGQLSVTFVPGEGVAAIPAQAITSGQTATKPTDPTKTGYTFKGWFKDVSGSAFDFGTAITEDTTLTAKWEINKYDVTFSGTNTAGVKVEHGQKVTEPVQAPTPNPAPDGGKEMYFVGWYADAAFTTEWDFDTTITKDTTIYAKFIEVGTQPTATREATGPATGGQEFNYGTAYTTAGLTLENSTIKVDGSKFQSYVTSNASDLAKLERTISDKTYVFYGIQFTKPNNATQVIWADTLADLATSTNTLDLAKNSTDADKGDVLNGQYIDYFRVADKGSDGSYTVAADTTDPIVRYFLWTDTNDNVVAVTKAAINRVVTPAN